MKNLTNEQRELLAKAFFYWRLDAALAAHDTEDGEKSFSMGMLSLIEFLNQLGIQFDREDAELLIDWSPKYGDE